MLPLTSSPRMLPQLRRLAPSGAGGVRLPPRPWSRATVPALVLVSAALAGAAVLVPAARPWAVPLAGLTLVVAALAGTVSRAGLPRLVHRLVTPLLAVYALLLGAGLGLGSAYLTLRRDFPIGGVRAGAWVTWPRVGSKEADPYARAVIARRGDIPLGIGEGLALTATGDDAGRPFDSACSYRITSPVPPARFWTLTLYEADHPAEESGRSGFTSAEILRDAEGRFEITLSREARPGNWLPLPAAGRLRLVLRLYDTPATVGSAALDARSVPAVTRLDCLR